MPRYFRHYKNGKLYELLHIDRIEADPDKKAVVYDRPFELPSAHSVHEAGLRLLFFGRIRILAL